MRLYFYLAVLVAGLAATGIAVAYFFWSESKIEKLAAQVAQVSDQAKALQATNDEIREALARINQLSEQTQQNLAAIRAEQTAAFQNFTRHDVQRDAARKPNLVGKTLDKNFNDFFKQMEEKTRAPDQQQNSGNRANARSGR